MKKPKPERIHTKQTIQIHERLYQQRKKRSWQKQTKFDNGLRFHNSSFIFKMSIIDSSFFHFFFFRFRSYDMVTLENLFRFHV